MSKKKKQPERGLCIKCRHATVTHDGTDGDPVLIRCGMTGIPQVANIHRCDIGHYTAI